MYTRLMNNLIGQLTNTFFPSLKHNSQVILFDSTASARELAFMLDGEWDNCNSVTLTKHDREAIEIAAALIKAQWCYCGDVVSWLPKVAEYVLLERYRAGERYFINANLRCSLLSKQCLKGANLSHAFLNEADLSKTDLSNADLSAADVSGANLAGANLTNTNLLRTNLTGANLSNANLSNAKLRKACLKGANLRDANLDGADLSLADLRGAELNNVSMKETNLTDTMLTIEQLQS